MTDKSAPFDKQGLEPYLAVFDEHVAFLSADAEDIVAPGMPTYYANEARSWAAREATSEREVITWAAAALASIDRMEWTAEQARDVALAYLAGWLENPARITPFEHLTRAIQRMLGVRKIGDVIVDWGTPPPRRVIQGTLTDPLR